MTLARISPWRRRFAVALGFALVPALPSIGAAEELGDFLSRRIFAAAVAQGLTREAGANVVRLLSENFDLEQPARPGDTLVLLRTTEGEVAAIQLRTRAIDAQLFRFAAPDRAPAFYDPGGRTAARALRRKPFDIMTASVDAAFGWREGADGKKTFHPNVGWRAPAGAKILAPADGVVTAVEPRPDGYRIAISHDGGYATGYVRLAAVAIAPAVGTRVAQGEPIGSLGEGVLQYEVLINNRFVDPLRIKLPSQGALEGDALAAFLAERDRLAARAASVTGYDLFAMR